MKLLILLGILLTQVQVFAESKSFDARDLARLTIQNLSGPVSVSVHETETAEITFKKRAWTQDCVMNVSKQFELLNISVEDRGVNSFSRDNCQVSLSIKVPARTNLDIKNGAGDVVVNGIKGAIDFKLGSGDLKINSVATKVSGTAGSGDIEITGEVGATSLRTGSGDIKIVYINPIEEGLIDIKTGSGDAEIELPPTMRILTDFKAGSGAVENEFGSDQGAKFKVSMRAGSGDLKIRKK